MSRHHELGRGHRAGSHPAPRVRRRRSAVASMAALVGLAGLGLAGERWLSAHHPSAALRRSTAALHAREAEGWGEVEANFRGDTPTSNGPLPRYERSGFRPSGILANPTRYNAAGRPWEYRYGAAHRWLGPADPDRTEAEIRDNFFALCREKSAFHARMAAKWASAARVPWLSVDPDPPWPPVVFEPPGHSW